MKTQVHDFDSACSALVQQRCPWGVIFKGGKAQLQAAGFGVDVVFPREPGGHKKWVTVTPRNGFARAVISCSEKGSLEPSNQATNQVMYRVAAYYLKDNRQKRRLFVPAIKWPGIEVCEDLWYDVYRGTYDAIVAAQLASPQEFPGQPGCGIGRTTFAPDGLRVQHGSNSGKAGNRTVLKAGARFEVRIQVSNEEREKRHAQYWHACDVEQKEEEERLAKHIAQLTAQRPRGHLRLVWSVQHAGRAG